MPQKLRTSELRQVGAEHQPTISLNAIASSQSENENAINITNNYYLIFQLTREEVFPMSKSSTSPKLARLLNIMNAFAKATDTKPTAVITSPSSDFLAKFGINRLQICDKKCNIRIQ